MQSVKQGEIFLANLNPVKGHEQSGFRPVLVLQNDILNEHLNTVVVAPLTTNLKAAGHLTTQLVKQSESGLKEDSVVLVHQIRTIDKVRLSKRVSLLKREQLHEVLRRLSLVF